MNHIMNHTVKHILQQNNRKLNSTTINRNSDLDYCETELDFILNLIANLRSCKPHKIFQDENVYPERAAVSILLRFNFNNDSTTHEGDVSPTSRRRFLEAHQSKLDALGFESRPVGEDNRLKKLLDDVRKYKPRLEVFFFHRFKGAMDLWSSRLLFPGEMMDINQDVTDVDVAVRACLEEVGLDLNSEDFMHLGELDDRQLRTMLGCKKGTILSPQVFLQTTQHAPPLAAGLNKFEKAGWVPLSYLLKHSSQTKHPDSHFSSLEPKLNFDLTEHLFPTEHFKPLNPLEDAVRSGLQFVMGNMYFSALSLPAPLNNTPLWGESLSLVSDLVDLGQTPRKIPDLVPLDATFPTFDSWPLNFILRHLCKPDKLRKPFTSRPSSFWDDYFRALHLAGPSLLLLRAAFILYSLRYFLSRGHHLLRTILTSRHKFLNH